MIGMYLGASDDASGIDQKPCGHRQLPGFVAVEPWEVDAESQVKLFEFFGQGEAQPQSSSILIIFVCQNRKGEPMFFYNLFRILVQLGRNGDNRASQFFDLAMDLLQSFQLCVAVRSPDATIKADGKRPFGKKVL